jgi:hypothetical protein
VEGLGEPVFVRAAQGNGHVGADFGWVVRVTVRRDNERAVGLEPALVNGAVGVVVAPRGRLVMVLCFTIARGKIVAIDAVGDPEPLRQLDLAVLTD